MDLFERTTIDKQQTTKNEPLAVRMRPRTLEEFFGQAHILGDGGLLRRLIESDRTTSIILYGPPGCGKTTLALIISERAKSHFERINAASNNVADMRRIIDQAKRRESIDGKKTILLIDEIHRFNKAQQDAFLPFVEDGTIILIGSTTENPSFEVISALLSRCKVFVLNKLTADEIVILLNRAVADKERGFGKYNIKIDKKTTSFIAQYSDGDARVAYNILELAVNSFNKNEKLSEMLLDIKLIENITQKRALMYDKHGEEHFNLISALHKSLRGSDPDAAAYWTIRMLEGGEDPLYIIRRMVRFASEDIGLADPNAMQVAIAAKQSFEFIGPPEGYLAIIEAAVYLALAPKSNSLYTTYKKVKNDVEKFGSLPVPYHIRNAPTRLMKEIGYSRGYKYDHDYDEGVSSQSYLPEKLLKEKYYTPAGRGYEKELIDRLKKISKLRQNKD